MSSPLTIQLYYNLPIESLLFRWYSYVSTSKPRPFSLTSFILFTYFILLIFILFTYFFFLSGIVSECECTGRLASSSSPFGPFGHTGRTQHCLKSGHRAHAIPYFPGHAISGKLCCFWLNFIILFCINVFYTFFFCKYIAKD